MREIYQVLEGIEKRRSSSSQNFIHFFSAGDSIFNPSNATPPQRHLVLYVCVREREGERERE